MDSSVFDPLLETVCGGIRNKAARAQAREELLDHLISESEVQMACGLREADAAAAVLRAFGDPAQIRRALRLAHRAENRRVILNVLTSVILLVLCFGVLHLASFICLLGYDNRSLILFQNLSWALMLLGLLRAIRGRSVSLPLIIFICALTYRFYAPVPSVLLPLAEFLSGKLIPFAADLETNTIMISGPCTIIQLGWVVANSTIALMIAIRNYNYNEKGRRGSPVVNSILRTLLICGVIMTASSAALTAYGYHSIRDTEIMQTRHAYISDYEIILAPTEAEADRLFTELNHLFPPNDGELQALTQKRNDLNQTPDSAIYLLNYHHDLNSAALYAHSSDPTGHNVTADDSVLIPRDACYSIEISRAVIQIREETGILCWKIQGDAETHTLPLSLQALVTLHGNMFNHRYEIILEPGDAETIES